MRFVWNKLHNLYCFCFFKPLLLVVCLLTFLTCSGSAAFRFVLFQGQLLFLFFFIGADGQRSWKRIHGKCVIFLELSDFFYIRKNNIFKNYAISFFKRRNRVSRKGKWKEQLRGKWGWRRTKNYTCVSNAFLSVGIFSLSLAFSCLRWAVVQFGCLAPASLWIL